MGNFNPNHGLNMGAYGINMENGALQADTLVESTLNAGVTVAGVLLKAAGATFGAAVEMGGFKITGLGAATTNGDAVRYEQLFGIFLPLAGGTMAGSISMGGSYEINASTGFYVETNGYVGIAGNALIQFVSGSVKIASGNLLMSFSGIGNDGSVLSFGTSGAGGLATFQGGLSINGSLDMNSQQITEVADMFVDDGFTVGIASNELLVFNSAGNITVSGADLFLGANGMGRDASVLTFATGGTGAATFGGNIVMPLDGWIGLGDSAARIEFDGTDDIDIHGADDVVVSESKDAGSIAFGVRNLSANAAASAYMQVYTNGGADVWLQLQTNDGEWKFGVDNDASETLRMNWNAAIGSPSEFALDTSGNLTISGSGTFAGMTLSGTLLMSDANEVHFRDPELKIWSGSDSVMNFGTDGSFVFTGPDANGDFFQISTTANPLIQIGRLDGNPTFSRITFPVRGYIFVGASQLVRLTTQWNWVAEESHADNLHAHWGNSLDAAIYYDTTNFILDPDLVGSGKVLIGATGDDDLECSGLKTNGGRILNTTRVTSGPYAVLASDHAIFGDTDGGAFEVDLPAGVAGTEYVIINAGTSGLDLTVDPNGADEIAKGGAGVAVVLTDGESLRIIFETTEHWMPA